jgi:Leucine-rich repeat (LRR) protein
MSPESLKRFAQNLSNASTCLLMLICVVSIALLRADVTTSQCPTECSCHLFDQLELTIDCQLMTRSESSGKKLFAQIDTMLSETNDSSTPLIFANQLQALEIINSPLFDVPPSICRLQSLRRLRFDNNNLRRLPETVSSTYPSW